MKKATKFVVPALILVAGLIFGSGFTEAKPAYGKAEKVKCTVCHPAGKTKELTKKGEFYKEHKTLEGAPEN